jgi:hypothetical protein
MTSHPTDTRTTTITSMTTTREIRLVTRMPTLIGTSP